MLNASSLGRIVQYTIVQRSDLSKNALFIYKILNVAWMFCKNFRCMLSDFSISKQKIYLHTSMQRVKVPRSFKQGILVYVGNSFFSEKKNKFSEKYLDLDSKAVKVESLPWHACQTILFSKKVFFPIKLRFRKKIQNFMFRKVEIFDDELFSNLTLLCF